MFHLERERALEKAIKGLLRAARRAVVAQERHDYWIGFGTNSKRAQSAAANREKALAALERAEVDAEEALNYG